MNFPLQSFNAVSAANPWTYVVFGLIGFAFGFTLEMSGFGNSRKLAGQFYRYRTEGYFRLAIDG